ncbi:MAG: FKBP-type peptidyl-prolyl cis-trans isomerase [Bacteroidota bacterium]
MKSIITKLFGSLLVILFVVSCSKETDERVIAQTSTGEMETLSGIKYEFIEHGTGEIPPHGGFWTLNITYLDSLEDVIFSSDQQGGTMPMPYDTAIFKKNASLEECLSLVGEGDSVIFFIEADSLYMNSYRQPAPPRYAGSKIEVRLGIDKIFTKEEFDEYNLAKLNELIESEADTIKAYIETNGINASKTEEGLYYEIVEEGTGDMPQEGQMVKVNYTGYVLDGTVFDSSIEEKAKEANLFNPARTYEPYAFPLGAGQVIKGWDIGIALLKEGGKAKLVIPSALAYGNRARSNIIKANSILVFDVELVEIVKE